MDQSFNELQRYCESHPEDLAAGERLFNHYLRLNDPLFNQLHDYLTGNPKKSEPRELHELLASFPAESYGPWLSRYVKTKTRDWPKRHFAMTGVNYRKYPDNFPFERIAPLISNIHLYSDESSNTDEFLNFLCSQFSKASKFLLVLQNRDYSQALQCLPEQLESLTLTGEIDALNSALHGLETRSIDFLRLNIEGSTANSNPLKIPSSICQSLETLLIFGRTTPISETATALNNLLTAPCPKLTRLAVNSVVMNAEILRRLTSSFFAPVLKHFEALNCELGQISSLSDQSNFEERNEISRLILVDKNLAPSDVSRVVDYFDFSSLFAIWVSTEGGTNEDIRTLLEDSKILKLPEIELSFSKVKRPVSSEWIEKLSSFGLKRLDILCESDPRADPHDLSYIQKVKDLKALERRLVSSERFPNLKTLNIAC